MCATSRNWSDYTSELHAYARASGRRHYNSVRKFRATLRRMEIVDWAHRHDTTTIARGIQSRLAEVFGVHRSTICRDLQKIAEENTARCACPTCGRELPIMSRTKEEREFMMRLIRNPFPGVPGVP